MSLVINDTRNIGKSVILEELESGGIYVNPYGNYIIVTDTGSIVDLSNGEAVDASDYTIDDEFVPVKARLEIYG